MHLSARHWYELTASTRRILSEPASCALNLANIPFDPAVISSGGIAPLTEVRTASGVFAQMGGLTDGLRVAAMRLDGKGFQDLGAGTPGLHLYRANFHLETTAPRPGASPAVLAQSADFPIDVCVDEVTNVIQSCPSCVTPSPSPTPSPSASCAIPIGTSCGGGVNAVAPTTCGQCCGTGVKDVFYPFTYNSGTSTAHVFYCQCSASALNCNMDADCCSSRCLMKVPAPNVGFKGKCQ